MLSTALDHQFLGVREMLERMSRHRGDLPPPQILLQSSQADFSYGDQDRLFDAASVDKVFIATLVMQLVDQKAISLTDRISEHLPESLYRGLFTYRGVDHAAEVRVEHLLTNTSGAADWVDDRTISGPTLLERTVADPEGYLTIESVLDFSRENQRAVAAPGQKFHYADNAYLLLTRLVEEVGQEAYATQVHERILEPAGMTRSCVVRHTLPGGAPAPNNYLELLNLAPMIIDGVDLSRQKWLAGSIAGTPGDFIRFSQALHRGELVSAPSYARMRRCESWYRPGLYYGAGFNEVRYRGFSPFYSGMPSAYGGIGVTGAHVYALPEQDMHFVINFNSRREMFRSFRTHIALVRAYLKLPA